MLKRTAIGRGSSPRRRSSRPPSGSPGSRGADARPRGCARSIRARECAHRRRRDGPCPAASWLRAGLAGRADDRQTPSHAHTHERDPFSLFDVRAGTGSPGRAPPACPKRTSSAKGAIIHADKAGGVSLIPLAKTAPTRPAPSRVVVESFRDAIRYSRLAGEYRRRRPAIDSGGSDRPRLPAGSRRERGPDISSAVSYGPLDHPRDHRSVVAGLAETSANTPRSGRGQERSGIPARREKYLSTRGLQKMPSDRSGDPCARLGA